MITGGGNAYMVKPKRAKEVCKLYKSSENNKLYYMLQNMPTPVILLDCNFTMRYINEAARALLRGNYICGTNCRGDECRDEIIAWIKEEIELLNNDYSEHEFKKTIETPDGKRNLHFNIRIVTEKNNCNKEYMITMDDHTDKDMAEVLINRSYSVTKTISQISARFVGVFDLDEEINHSLKDIGETTGASRAHIFMISDDFEMVDNTHEWCAQNIDSRINSFKNMSTSIFPWWTEKIRRGHSIYVEDVKNMPKEAQAEKDILESRNVRSLVFVPFKINSRIVGFVGIIYINDEKKWNNYDVLLLKLATEVFSKVFERQEIENKFKRSEEKYRKLVESSPDAIVIHENGIITYANRQTAELFAADSVDELIGRNVMSLVAPHCRKAVKQRIEKRIEENGIQELVEEQAFTLDGRSIDIEVKAALIENQPTLVHQTVIRDITERKRMEEELKIKNKELEDAIEKLEKAQVQLVQQEKIAAIGQLAAGVAHEINNPLGFILSNFDTLKKYELKLQEIMSAYRKLKNICEKKRAEGIESQIESINILEKRYKVEFMEEDMWELLKESTDGLDRISRIVKGLRIFSRVDHHDEFEEYNLNMSIENTLLIVANEIKYHANIDTQLGDIPNLYGVAGQINQVLLNLIMNASQAIKAKKSEELGLITIKTYEEKSYVCCEVSDTGEGISKENLDKIFNPFFTTKPVGEGTGLGLSISYDIIKNKHNGEIEVESEVGMGTKFVLRIPMSKEAYDSKNIY